MSSVEYFQWRQKAAGAKRIKEVELVFLKDWIRERVAQEKEQRREMHASSAGVSVDDPRGLIQASYNLFCLLKRCGVEYTEDDRALIATLRNYLKQS